MPLIAAVGVVADLLGFVVGRAESSGWLLGDGTVGDLTGSMVLELQDGSYVEQDAASDQMEVRDEHWQGTIRVEASGDHTGEARLTGSASYVPTDTGPVVAHQWGTAEVTLDGQACSGAYSYNSYRDSDVGGGRNWTITVALTKGYLFER